MNFITNEEELKLNEDTQAVYFYAPWLIYHKKMMVMFDKVKNKHKNIIYTAVDISHFKKIADMYEVDSIPTVIVFHKGKEINRINGVCLTSAFKAFFDDILKDKIIGDKNGKENKI
jgi:thioredoxin-like negative regulator of GroEL